MKNRAIRAFHLNAARSRSVYWLFQLLQGVAQAVSRPTAYRIGHVIAELFFLCSRRSRPNCLANILHILRYQGERIDDPRVRTRAKAIVRQNFRNFASYLVDFFRFSRLEAADLASLVEVEGRENVDRALRRGKGAVGVTAHVGNWELGGIVLSLLGYPVNAVALSYQNTKLNRLFVNQRAIAGVKVITVGTAALQSLRALKKNELVVILGDRDVTERGVTAEFFGAPAHIPRGPAVLAARSGASLFFGCLIRTSAERYRVVFRPPLEVDESLDPVEKEALLTRALLKEMEEVIMAHLDQWYMYYRVWGEGTPRSNGVKE
jgi:KDO2-lipid IV(A) lauroyltransferase